MIYSNVLVYVYILNGSNIFFIQGLKYFAEAMDKMEQDASTEEMDLFFSVSGSGLPREKWDAVDKALTDKVHEMIDAAITLKSDYIQVLYYHDCIATSCS